MLLSDAVPMCHYCFALNLLLLRLHPYQPEDLEFQLVQDSKQARPAEPMIPIAEFRFPGPHAVRSHPPLGERSCNARFSRIEPFLLGSVRGRLGASSERPSARQWECFDHRYYPAPDGCRKDAEHRSHEPQFHLVARVCGLCRNYHTQTPEPSARSLLGPGSDLRPMTL